MRISREKLKFINIVNSKKPHFIFRQGNKYMTMTTTENGTRGNMFLFPTYELNNIIKKLSHNGIPNKFKYDIIFPKVKKAVNHRYVKEYKYWQSRFLNACYVLTGLKYLTIIKDGNKIYFKKVTKLKNGELINGKKKKSKKR